MINNVTLQGRLVRDAELNTTTSGISVASFCLACERSVKNAEGKYDADFINCTAWRGTADFVSKWFKKGDQMVITGRIQTRSYEKDGQKRTITEVMVNEVSFCGSKNNAAVAAAAPQFTEVDEAEGDLPF